MNVQCMNCGMIRAKKDMVTLSNHKFVCFSCWNKSLKEKENPDAPK